MGEGISDRQLPVMATDVRAWDSRKTGNDKSVIVMGVLISGKRRVP